MLDPVLFGISTSALTVLIVQGLKKLGLPARFGAWAALAVSVGLVALGLMVRLLPESTPFVEAAVAGVVVWLTAIGIYEKGKDVGEVWKS